ncbi:MAG TPA: glutamyl-tRNA reductase [Candidatus Binatia bacterium]|nr:glutamyl-tRNA reductase [Candidatus Binatia bacterium]
MPILVLGVSYRRASVELLERLAFGREDLPKAYHHLLGAEAIRGAVILSTCNRVEVAADVDAYHGGFQALRSFLAESRDVDPAELAEPLYSHYEEQAAEHLFSVAAGLDSMVRGEPQILSQVRQAYRAAEAEEAPGPVLTALYNRAIRAGRRARSETAIGAGPGAFVEAGASLAERAVGGLAGRSLLVVGAGKMSELALRHLMDRGVGRATVLSRSPDRAARLARVARAAAGGLPQIPEALAETDLVVSATGAAGIVIGRETVARALQGRGGRPLFLLDLAVPRDVEASAAELPGVHLANIDHLKDLVPAADEREVESARRIVQEEVARFTAWRRAARLAPVIEELYSRGERIRRAELDRFRARLAGLTEDERQAVEAATRAIVAKLLHNPVVRTKEAGDALDQQSVLLARLFGLEEPPPA